MTRGVKPRPFDPAVEIHLDAGLVTIAGRKNNAVFLCVYLQDRPDRCVDLGIHQHDILAMLEGLQNRMRAELDGTSDVDHDVDQFRARQQERVFGRYRFIGADRIVELPLIFSNGNVLIAGILKDVDRSADLPVVYSDHAHSRRAMHNLVS